MPADERNAPRPHAPGPASFTAAALTLNAIREALDGAGTAPGAERDTSTAEPSRPSSSASSGAAGSRLGSGDTGSVSRLGSGDTGSEQALAALLLLREVRDQLAAWEPALIEEARAAGASWADLAHPLGVSSRQAAERRYLRVRPGTPGSTREQRVQATRDRRAADRSVIAWARANAAELRQLAGQITALTDLPAASRTALADLTHALAADDAADVVAPLAATYAHLEPRHPDLAARVDDITRHTDQLRRDSGDQRRNRA
ncbi:type III effector protein [Streptomyces sp. Da 82-17]|uniref:type III effector protein n=1 Tax=Streptomyces sp. Da 82-17 TaxID=3377116 RepID=UPI0038D38C99